MYAALSRVVGIARKGSKVQKSESEKERARARERERAWQPSASLFPSAGMRPYATNVALRPQANNVATRAASL